MTQTALARAAVRQVRTFEVHVAEVVRETRDTVTLWLDAGEPVDYRPGQFVTVDPHQFEELAVWTRFLEVLKGRREPPRAYSLASAPHEGRLAITVKEEPYVPGATEFPPLLSPLLCRRLAAGRRLVVTGCTGPYVLADDIAARADHVLHVCAGSGIVPNFSMIKHALHRRLPVRHTLLYGNRSWDQIIFRAELDELARRFPYRLRVIHALSRDPDPAGRGPDVVAGRIGGELIAAQVDDPAAVVVFACGPAVTSHERKRARQQGELPAPRFMESVTAALAGLGIAPNRIHTESYG